VYSGDAFSGKNKQARDLEKALYGKIKVKKNFDVCVSIESMTGLPAEHANRCAGGGVGGGATPSHLSFFSPPLSLVVHGLSRYRL
jgi:hypothetical protein